MFLIIFSTVYILSLQERSLSCPLLGESGPLGPIGVYTYIIFPALLPPFARAGAPSPHAGTASVEVSVRLISANGSCVSNILG